MEIAGGVGGYSTLKSERLGRCFDRGNVELLTCDACLLRGHVYFNNRFLCDNDDGGFKFNNSRVKFEINVRSPVSKNRYRLLYLGSITDHRRLNFVTSRRNVQDEVVSIQIRRTTSTEGFNINVYGHQGLICSAVEHTTCYLTNSTSI